MAFSAVQLSQAKAFRISPKDTNYFVMLFDGASDRIANIFVIEIFRPGGATPPNVHATAHEFFHVLHGEGIARCDDKTLPIKKGDTLTVMTPNEGFAELIQNGEPVEIETDDLRVLQGAG